MFKIKINIKNHLFFIFFLLIFKVNAQIKYIKVTYKKQSVLENTLDSVTLNDKIKLKDILEFQEKQNEALKDVTFTLLGNNKGESIFKPNDFITIEGDRWKKLFVKLGGGGDIIYSNITKNEQLWEKEAFGSLFLVSNKVDKINWKLTNESKVINNYSCLKALGKNEIESQGQTKSIDVTAWYVPQINYPFGPVEYSNLPGLIIEVEYSGNRFYAIEIIFFEDEKKLIEKPIKGKKVNLKELKEIGRNLINKAN